MGENEGGLQQGTNWTWAILKKKKKKHTKSFNLVCLFLVFNSTVLESFNSNWAPECKDCV